MWQKTSSLRSASFAAIFTLPVTVAGALSLASTAAHAVPVELSFSGTVTSSPFLPPGATVGAPITWNVFADNGGTSLSSQTWTASQITSTAIQAGTYSATTSGPQITFPNFGMSISGFGSFSTDASGHLQFLQIRGDQNGSDSNGNSSFVYFMNAGPAPAIWFINPAQTQSISVGSPPSIENTTISQVPLPAALPLFASGIGGLGLLGWRRKRKLRAAVA